MPLDISPVPRSRWTTLSQQASVNVEGKALLVQDNLTIALFRIRSPMDS